MSDLRVHVYSLCWNERHMLPFYFRHYRGVATKFIIFDDSSDDGSAEYLRAQPDVELGSFQKDEDSFVRAAQRFYNECWKRSRGQADWVIICNIDEHLHHPDLAGYLRRLSAEGCTIVPAQGYEMVSDSFPAPDERLSITRPHGARSTIYDKLAIFAPDALAEVAYSPGRHDAEPLGRVVAPDVSEVKLLHYKYLGLEYLTRRFGELRTGLRAADITNRWGSQYSWPAPQVEAEFSSVRSRAFEVVL